MRLIIISFAFGGFFLARCANAVVIGSDLAGNSAYSPDLDGAWKGLQPSISENPLGMDNGGYGFLPWDFVGGFHDALLSPYGRLNHLIDGVDFAASSFNNLGAPAFGLPNANEELFGFTARATRVFSQPLAVGGSISVKFDNPLLAPMHSNDFTGYIIRLNSGGGARIASNPNVQERFGLFAQNYPNQEEDWNWRITHAPGVSDTGLHMSSTTSGAIFRLTLEATESFRFEILSVTGANVLYSTTGTLVNSGPIDTLEILMFGNGSGNGETGALALATGEREFFFNELTLDNPAPSINADYNRDGIVDAADYIAWRKGGNTPNAPGYYVGWRANFGESATGASSQIAVPEPEAALTLFTSLLAIMFIHLRFDRESSSRLTEI